MNAECAITIDSDGLKLEGMLRDGDGDLSALVLHPHPEYGGDMHNHVVVAVCEALADLGAATLRFNFRGTGRSEGAHDRGPGETNDARAAAASMRAANPNAKLLLVGYSFGAMIAAMVAVDVKPDAVVLISPPVGVATMPSLEPALPVLVITGERDSVAPAARLRALGAPNHTIVVVPGADHGWWPGVVALTEAVTSFVAEAVAQRSPI